MKKKALIFGITGQTGSYLCELLLSKDYEVHGVVRPVSTFNRERIDHIFDTPEKRQQFLHYGDISDPFSVAFIIKEIQPDEIYNLAALSHVGISWKMPYSYIQTTGIGILNIIQSVQLLNLKCKIYQAGTSELFSGRKGEAPQNEDTPKDPVSPYGTAKLYAFQIAKNYREAYDMFICNGILFNHESVRRGENFVTKKIVASSYRGEVRLGNLDASRDWGYAPEYAEGIWEMMQLEKPDDYVLATGETHTVKEFVKWVEEVTGKEIKVIIDKHFIRPHDVPLLQGDASKAKFAIGWKPKIKGKELVKKMTQDYGVSPYDNMR